MLETLFLRGKNEDTLLPRILRILAQQGRQIESLNSEVQKNDNVVNIEVTMQKKAEGSLTETLLRRVVGIEIVVAEEIKQIVAM